MVVSKGWLMEDTVTVKVNLPRAQAGELDRAAFDEMYARYLPKVYNYVCYKVGNQSLAEDITSEVFERALTRLGTYRAQRGAFSTWLFRIAHNQVANHLRSARRRPEIYSLEDLTPMPVSDASPEQAAIESERWRRVRTQMQELPEPQQEVIALKFGWGLSNQEIAQATKTNANHVGVLLYRAVRALRLALESEEVSR